MNNGFQAGKFLQDFLRMKPVVPEIGSNRLLFQRGNLLFFCIYLKDTSPVL